MADRLLELVALSLFVALLLQNFALHLDLHPADEAMYQAQGAGVLRGELGKTLWFAPVYSAAYAVLQILPLQGAAVSDAMAVLVIAVGAFSAWWGLGPFLSRPATLLAAGWWASSYAFVHPLRIYLFTTSLGFFAVGCAGRRRPVVALAVLVLAVANRTEVLAWLMAAAVALAWWGQRRREPRLRNIAALVATGAAGMFVVLAMVPAARERSWVAFQNHYYSADLTTGPPAGVVGPVSVTWGEMMRIARDTFAGADSVPSALVQHPAEFAGHLLYNLCALPANLAHVVSHPFPHLPTVRLALLAIVGFLALAGLLRGGVRRTVLGSPPGPAAHMVLWTSLLVVPASLLIYPRTEYLLVVAPVLLVLGGRLVERGALRLLGDRRVPGVSTIAVAAMLVSAALLPGAFTSKPASDLRTREVVAVLRRNDLTPGAVIAAPSCSGLVELANLDAITVDTEDVFGSTAETPEPDYVVITDWHYKVAYRDAMLAVLSSDQWRLLDAGLGTWLFARRDR